MNFVAKCCQPTGILGDFAVDRWKFIDFTRPGILRPSPCTDKKNGIAHCSKAIYLNLSELNTKFLIKHLRSVAGKLIEIKKPPENLVISPRET